MMKSSKDKEKARSAAAAIPGKTNGKVTRRKVCHSFAYKSIAACSRRGSKDAIRALTVTTTKEMQNITWAMMVVSSEVFKPTLMNIVRSDAPRTISGVAIGKKIKRFVVERPLNLYLPNAKAINVPKTVATKVELKPIKNEFPSALQISGAPHGLLHFSKVKPFQIRLVLPESLKEKIKV